MRRDDKQIVDRDELDRILRQTSVARLGLIDGDRPYVVPLHFAYEGDVVWFHCAAEGRKLECLRQNPAVCVEVDRLVAIHTGPSACNDWTSNYESVIAFGSGEIVEDEAVMRQGLTAIMRKYSGRDDWEFPAERLRATRVIRVRLDSLTGKRSPVSS
jgi:nitroimidazol reductase NimA-like FMN-containing flavoprotein (pyridoxamine 5'-phosphate oxidase superfamily)